MFKRDPFSETLGLIAGKGEFPIIFAEALFALKQPLIVFGVKGQTDPRVEPFAKETHYMDLGALGHLVDLLKKTKVKKVVLAGGIPKFEIYNPSFQMDETAKGFIHQTRNKGDDHILKALQFFLKVKCGVSIADARVFLKNLLAPKGVMTRRIPTPSEREDLKFGWRIAKGIGKMDIGQTVVVKDGVVLAVEALEGTDAAIRRGGKLSRTGAVIVKVAKPNQDLRFDLPCVGHETLESMKAVGARVIGVETQKTVMLSKDRLIEEADQADMSILGI
ncbi:MAG: hypothetical protein AUJ71_00150 [Candidatus Omnitrophica bacterium CG1_02_49_16]|nr:MAG: hypothetical protein AUJ71_00150 [Candidatus Omnitrophica bacterium CG1_02_49_16]